MRKLYVVNVHTPGYLMETDQYWEQMDQFRVILEAFDPCSTNAAYQSIVDRGLPVHREGMRKFEFAFETKENAEGFAEQVGELLENNYLVAADVNDEYAKGIKELIYND